MADAVNASALLPVLIDEIRRLKDMHVLAAGAALRRHAGALCCLARFGPSPSRTVV